MAPEMLAGNDYDCQIDIWSFGVLAAELSHKCRPNMDIFEPGPMLNRINDKAGMPKLSDRDWSTEFKDFVKKCLVKNPQERATAN